MLFLSFCSQVRLSQEETNQFKDITDFDGSVLVSKV